MFRWAEYSRERIHGTCLQVLDVPRWMGNFEQGSSDFGYFTRNISQVVHDIHLSNFADEKFCKEHSSTFIQM